MSALKSIEIEVSEQQQSILEHLSRSRIKPVRLVQRAQIILSAVEGMRPQMIAKKIGLSRSQIWLWRKRWSEAQNQLQKIEEEGGEAKVVEKQIEVLLDDRVRSGCPATFEVETILQILLLAQEEPADSGRPVSHWSPRELRQEVIKRGIVKEISQRSISRFLKGSQSQASPISKLAESRRRQSRSVKHTGCRSMSVIRASVAIA